MIKIAIYCPALIACIRTYLCGYTYFLFLQNAGPNQVDVDTRSHGMYGKAMCVFIYLIDLTL